MLPRFQPWYHFDPKDQQWHPKSLDTTARIGAEPSHGGGRPSLVLLTWNIDAGASRPQERASEIITAVTQLDPRADIIFLQEVSKLALQQILTDDRIRQDWFVSEHEDTTWGNKPFTTVTLLSKKSIAVPGPIWRIDYPSHFGRTALCCDVFVPSGREPVSGVRVRLINVHLDSLPIKPSHRPEQVSIASAFLRSAGCGLVAGDFNPVLDQDAELVEDNGLTDAWKTLRPDEPGYTWGADGQQPFPPSRLDKIALLGLQAHTIEAIEPKVLKQPEKQQNLRADTNSPGLQQTPIKDPPSWSDHHALLCSFGLVEQ